MQSATLAQSQPRLRTSRSTEDRKGQNAEPNGEEKRRRGRVSYWLFRSLPSADKKPRSSSWKDLQLVARWNNKKAAGDVLCLPSREGGSDDDEEDMGSISSGSSLSTVGELQQQQEEMVLLDSPGPDFQEGSKLRVIPPYNSRDDPIFDLQQYMAKREMTATQEKWNALTMIPSPLYCIYFLLAGRWLDPSLVQEVLVDASYRYEVPEGCLAAQSWHNMPALPPLPVLAAAFGIIFHAPFSFLYHWKYAHSLPPGAARTTHWSRRMDQAMIHFASACMSYATSGSWDFFVANCLFNADCMYRQFKTRVRPRRNKIRIIISILAYTIPIFRRGDAELFLKLWLVLLISGWLFIHYPIGGWSHAAFHLTIAFAPPLLMLAALDLPASQEALTRAAQCAAATLEQ